MNEEDKMQSVNGTKRFLRARNAETLYVLLRRLLSTRAVSSPRIKSALPRVTSSRSDYCFRAIYRDDFCTTRMRVIARFIRAHTSVKNLICISHQD